MQADILRCNRVYYTELHNAKKLEQKITTGTSETTFSPMSDCTRGQIVTFLYRAANAVA